MTRLAIVEQGLTLTVEAEMLNIQREGETIRRVRLKDVEQILLFGSVSLTPAAIAAVLLRGIDVVFLTRRGRYRGRLQSGLSKNIELRLAQFRRFCDPSFALPLAAAFVRGKIVNQRTLLLRAQREQRREDLAAVIGQLRQLLRLLEEVADIDALRGIEGQGAALYFSALGRCVRNPAFRFETRTRRPPKDPLNAVLSFGYTLLGATMEAFVWRVGFDPMLGVFHAPRYGRPSLMLDLIEEFRPLIVDSLMLRLANRREITPEDFEEAFEDEDAFFADPDGGVEEEGGRGVWLSESGRKIFFRAWGRRLNETIYYPARGQRLTLEEIMLAQVYQLSRVVRGEQEAYEPFTPR